MTIVYWNGREKVKEEIMSPEERIAEKEKRDKERKEKQKDTK